MSTARKKSATAPVPVARRKRATVGRPRKTEGSIDATKRILDAAEELFSKHGFDAVTMRAVAALANVDAALAHYYFDTKKGLFEAVLDRRAGVVFAERMAALDLYEAQFGDAVEVEGAVAAFLLPLLEQANKGDEGWRHYFRLIAHVNNAPGGGGPSEKAYFDPVVHKLIGVIKRALPDAPEEDLYWCFLFLTGSLTLALSRTGRIDRLSGGICHSDDLGSLMPRMVKYCTAGFKSVCVSSAKNNSESKLRRPVSGRR